MQRFLECFQAFGITMEIRMGRRKGKTRQQRPAAVPKQSSPLPIPATPHQERKPIWKKVPGWLWALVTACGVVVGLLVLYPSLSINEDFSFDQVFPYNSSFSITNEGYWPIANLSAACSADFTMLPWDVSPSNKSSMNLHTEDDNHKDFSKELRYKQRVTVPCNHNVVANGHRIAPGAKLKVTIGYRFAGTNIHRSQTFNFRTVMGSQGQSYWQYDD
jgi:hypothetical protein